MAVTAIRSETPSRLTLVSIDGEEMVLAPLQEKTISEDSGFDFDEVEREGLVSQREDAPSGVGEQISVAVLGGGFWFVVGGVILSGMEPWWGIPDDKWPYAVWGTEFLVLAIIVGALVIRGTNSLSLVVRWTMQAVALTGILAIGLGLPAATIYFFGGGQQFLDVSAHSISAVPQPAGGDAAADGEIEPPADSATEDAQTPPAATLPLALFGRLIQLAFIATASLLPVLLFFLFDRYQLGTLRKRLYSNLFRLDRSVATLSEIDAKYGSQISEAYGADDQGRGRLGAGSRGPVLVCAFVITIAWIVALAPVGTDFAPQSAADVLEGLMPQRSALVFGFLGVYFFSLRLIALRYARGDLKPKAYSHIMVRIFIVVVLSWVLEAIFTDDSTVMLVLAFLFGITPDEFFTWLRESFRGKVPVLPIPQPTLPLNDLEGIDLYDLGRLESEGIVNIEGLAHHELLELIIETRIPVPRLVDWVDQAILYVHLIGGADTDARAKLRDYGIRTATDLLRAWKQAKRRSKEEFEAFKKLLGDEQPPYRLEVIRDALLDDEWMTTVSCWRNESPHPSIVRRAVPSSVEALERRADKELAAKRYRRAMTFLEQSLGIKDTASVRRKLALILATSPVPEDRDPDKASEHAARAFELAPTDYTGIVELITVYIALDDVENAKARHALANTTVKGWQKSKQKEKRKETDRLAKLGGEIDRMVAPEDTDRSSSDSTISR